MADNVQWIKLKVGMFDGDSFKRIKRAKIGGVSYRDKLTAIWFELLDLAGKSNADGYLINNNEIPYKTYEDIAIMLDRDENEIELCMDFFIAEKMVEIIDDVYCLTNFLQYQNQEGLAKIREQRRISQAKWRERSKLGLIGTPKTSTVESTQPSTERLPSYSYSNSSSISNSINSKKERKNINKSVRTQESYDKILESSNLAEKVIDSLQTFIQHRCLIKKPLLNKELKELISTLKEQYKTDEEMVQALDKAVKGGYTYIKTEQPQTANNTAEKVNVDEELRKRKNHAESIAQDNLDKMLKDKKFKEVYEQLNSIERELAFAEMGNDKEKMSYLLNQRTKVRFTGTMILQNNGFEWEDLQPHYHCEKCKDTGWIGTKECTCRKELRG